MISDCTVLKFDILFGIFGLAVGGFLNLLSARSLQEASLLEVPRCTACKRRLSISQFIPVLSYLLCRGKCPYCQSPIAWYEPLVEVTTALIFIFTVRIFGLTPYGFGMLFFFSALIAVCITDFKEKLIPHDITYPSIIVGIIFSINIRHDLWGTMAGIGLSYIFFDFMAFYGLKLYLWLNKPRPEIEHKHLVSLDPQGKRPKTKIRIAIQMGLQHFSLDQVVQLFSLKTRKVRPIQSWVLEDGEPLAELEVIGGGDAVLSALIAAWLGFNRLVLALIVGFLIGTIMGAAYLMHELLKRRLLRALIRPVLICAFSMTSIMAAMLALIANLTRLPFQAASWYILLPAAALCGALFGVIIVGRQVSKPFPFGPALALGAAFAAIRDPSADPGPQVNP